MEQGGLDRKEQAIVKKITWLMVWDWIGLFHRVVYILLFLSLGFAVPFRNRTATWVIGFIVINWATELRFWAKLKRILEERRRQQMFLFTILYFIYLIGLLYSNNMQYARFDITVKLSLLVFPLLFATIDGRVFSFLRLNYILLTYVIGSFSACIVGLTNAAINYYHGGDISVFFYSDLSLMHHSGYMAMFIDFAIVVVFFLTLNNLSIFKSWHLVLITILLLFFNLMVVLLSSKMGILTLLVIYLLISAILFSRKPTRKKSIYPLMMMATVLLLMFSFPQTIARVERGKHVIGNISSVKADSQESTGERILIWRSAWQIIREHPFLGVGTGDVKDALLEEYEREGIKYAYSKNLDAHNQYLQTYLSVGLVGFVLLIAMLAWPGFLAFFRKDYIYLFFILIFSMNILTESMFENQAGVVFYAFFNALLFWYFPSSQGKQTLRT